MAISLRLLCDVANESQTLNLATFIQKSHSYPTAMSRRHRSWVTLRLSYKMFYNCWRPLCDVAIGSQTGHLATFIYKSHSFPIAMSRRHHSRVTWRLYTKCCIFTWRPSCDPFAMSQLSRLATFNLAMSPRLSFLTGTVYRTGLGVQGLG